MPPQNESKSHQDLREIVNMQPWKMIQKKQLCFPRSWSLWLCWFHGFWVQQTPHSSPPVTLLGFLALGESGKIRQFAWRKKLMWHRSQIVIDLDEHASKLTKQSRQCHKNQKGVNDQNSKQCRVLHIGLYFFKGLMMSPFCCEALRWWVWSISPLVSQEIHKSYHPTINYKLKKKTSTPLHCQGPDSPSP